MKVALVHDQLNEFGGAERVLASLKKIFPQADIYTSTYNPQGFGPQRDIFKKWNIQVSWFGKIPIIKNLYSPFRFLTPAIWESFDFSKYDLVISSSGSWMCKGIITRPKAVHPLDDKYPLHISYIHHPPRYLYGYETAIEWQKYLLVKIYGNIVNHFLRVWDFEASQRPDYLIANSEETKRRIQKFYRRDATVIYPPVNIPSSSVIQSLRSSRFARDDNNYYITVSRLARAKHIDILIKAANKEKFKLKVVGSGRDAEYLKSLAGGTVEFLGNISDKELAKLYKSANAFLFSAVDEEFGIAPVEAMAYGLPVIAYRSGGIPETVKDGINGYLFNELAEDSLIKKIHDLENLPKEKYSEMRLSARKTAENFSEENFKKNILQFVKYARASRS